MRPYREAEHLLVNAVGDREIALRGSQMSIGPLPMGRDGVVDKRVDAGFF